MTLPGSGCTDISYIPMCRGFLYLVAVMDWHSRKVLSLRLSNSMDAGFCIERQICFYAIQIKDRSSQGRRGSPH